MKKVRDALQWVRKKIGNRGIAGIAFLLYAAVPDYDGRNHWWLNAWIWARPFVTRHSRVIIILLGLFLIWLDHRRILQKHLLASRIDPNSLKGRALALRDEMQAYLNANPQPRFNKFLGESTEHFIKRVSQPASLRAWKLAHGYELYFASRLKQIFHEYGIHGFSDMELARIIDSPYKTDEGFKTVIQCLTRLSERGSEKDAEVLSDEKISSAMSPEG